MIKKEMKFHQNEEFGDHYKTRFQMIQGPFNLNRQTHKLILKYPDKTYDIQENDQITMSTHLIGRDKNSIDERILRWKHIEEYVKNEKVMVLERINGEDYILISGEDYEEEPIARPILKKNKSKKVKIKKEEGK